MYLLVIGRLLVGSYPPDCKIFQVIDAQDPPPSQGGRPEWGSSLSLATDRP